MFFTVETPVFSPDNDGYEDVGVFHTLWKIPDMLPIYTSTITMEEL